MLTYDEETRVLAIADATDEGCREGRELGARMADGAPEVRKVSDGTASALAALLAGPAMMARFPRGNAASIAFHAAFCRAFVLALIGRDTFSYTAPRP